MDGDDVIDDLVDVATPGFSLGRWLRWMLYGGMVALGISAVLSGSGGTGDAFNPDRFFALLAGSLIVIGLVAALTDPGVRRRSEERDA